MVLGINLPCLEPLVVEYVRDVSVLALLEQVVELHEVGSKLLLQPLFGEDTEDTLEFINVENMLGFTGRDEVGYSHKLFGIYWELLKEVLCLFIQVRFCQEQFVLSIQTAHLSLTYFFIKQLIVHQKHDGERSFLRAIGADAEPL